MRLIPSLIALIGATATVSATASATTFAANITAANHATTPQPEDPVLPLIQEAVVFALGRCDLYFEMRHLYRETTETLIMLDPMLEKEAMEEVLAKTEGTKIKCVKLTEAILKGSEEELLEALEECYGCGV